MTGHYRGIAVWTIPHRDWHCRESGLEGSRIPKYLAKPSSPRPMGLRAGFGGAVAELCNSTKVKATKGFGHNIQ